MIYWKALMETSAFKKLKQKIKTMFLSTTTSIFPGLVLRNNPLIKAKPARATFYK